MKKIFYPLLFSGSLVISYFIIQAYNNGNMVLVKQLLIGWISPFLILACLIIGFIAGLLKIRG